jgi:nickel-dependent lactate racemase
MKALSYYAENAAGISRSALNTALEDALSDCQSGLKRVLLIPPDFTRLHSLAGPICNRFYHLLEQNGCHVDVLPALGTHAPVTQVQAAVMFGDIPFRRILVHNWRTDVVKLGVVPANFVREVSEGIMDEDIPVEVNHLLVDGDYDLILSIGQVVPHEVVGMANYSKNIFVGVGGSHMINASHMLGAFYGLERLMGRDHSPVRRVFDYAQEHFLADLPLSYVLTVTSVENNVARLHGLFGGEGRLSFEKAVELSQQKNIFFVEQPLSKAVVYLDPAEFHSTWVGNKSIYRTRMAIADKGELIILAPGVSRFGEDAQMDALIRRYGYCGRENVIRLFHSNADLQANQGAAAHLIHGSADGRFSITYCTSLIGEQDIRQVGYDWADYQSVARRYSPSTLHEGYNLLPDGERIYYIGNPAVGLWAERRRF